MVLTCNLGTGGAGVRANGMNCGMLRSYNSSMDEKSSGSRGRYWLYAMVISTVAGIGSGILGYFRRGFADPNDIIADTVTPDHDIGEAACSAVAGFLILFLVFYYYWPRRSKASNTGNREVESKDPPKH